LPDNIKDYISTLQGDNQRYITELQSLQTQLNNLTAVVDFADSTKIAEIADLKQRHQQELATINILMEGDLIGFFAFGEKKIFCFFLCRNNS
jgi:hypothetical protein